LNGGLFLGSNEEECNGRDMSHIWGRGELRTYRNFVGNPDGKRDHMEHPGVDGSIILKWVFRK
jgi:hypothetical protein